MPTVDAIEAMIDRFDGDPGFAEEVGLCVEYQIPLSRWLGWDEADKTAALAYRRWKATRCPKCGSRHSDWIDDEGHLIQEPSLHGKAERCEGCAEISATWDKIPSEDRDGVTVRLSRKREGDE